jgi:hypothetical protein
VTHIGDQIQAREFPSGFQTAVLLGHLAVVRTPEPPGTPPQPPPDPTAPPPYEDPPRPIPIPRPDEPPIIDDPPPRRNA